MCKEKNICSDSSLTFLPQLFLCSWLPFTSGTCGSERRSRLCCWPMSDWSALVQVMIYRVTWKLRNKAKKLLCLFAKKFGYIGALIQGTNTSSLTFCTLPSSRWAMEASWAVVIQTWLGWSKKISILLLCANSGERFYSTSLSRTLKPQLLFSGTDWDTIWLVSFLLSFYYHLYYFNFLKNQKDCLCTCVSFISILCSI